VPQAPRYIGVTDADHVFVAVSGDLAALLGYAPRELVGMPSERILLGLEGADLEGARRQAAENGGLNGELLLRHRDGRPIRYRYSMRAVVGRDGAGCYVTVGEPLELGGGPGELGGRALLTKAEAASVARRSVRSIDRAVAAGELPAAGRPGQRRLIDLRDLQRWLGASLTILLLLGLLACLAGLEQARDLMSALGCPLMS
jgi:hypothetical protein